MRSRSFSQSVVLGLFGQAVVMLTGLWLSPFLLLHLGAAQLGIWIVGQQLLTYLTMLDVGVVALVPREIAYATGAANPAREAAATLARTIRILVFQAPCVWVVAAGLAAAARAWAPGCFAAVGIAATAFSIAFPFRAARATLEGLQDLAFTSSIWLAAWFAGFVVSVGCVIAALGLPSLALGFAATQLFDAAACAARVWSKHRAMVPRLAEIAAAENVAGHFHRALWMSVSQIAQVLVYGTDAAVVARSFGAAAVVPYNATGKLAAVLANQPQHIMRAAEPGLSQMRVTETRARIAEVTGALSLAMLLASGFVATLAIAVNGGFVNWWMGPANYAGLPFTVLFVLSMVLRHLNVTFIYTLYALRHERFLAGTALLDGVVSTALSITLARLLQSPMGVVLGSIASTSLILCFGNGRLLARELERSFGALLKPLAGWFWRMLLAGCGAAILSANLPEPAIWMTAVTGLIAASAYAVLMLPVALESALKPYLVDHLSVLRRLRPWMPAQLGGRT